MSEGYSSDDNGPNSGSMEAAGKHASVNLDDEGTLIDPDSGRYKLQCGPPFFQPDGTPAFFANPRSDIPPPAPHSMISVLLQPYDETKYQKRSTLETKEMGALGSKQAKQSDVNVTYASLQGTHPFVTRVNVLKHTQPGTTLATCATIESKHAQMNTIIEINDLTNRVKLLLDLQVYLNEAEHRVLRKKKQSEDRELIVLRERAKTDAEKIQALEHENSRLEVRTQKLESDVHKVNHEKRILYEKDYLREQELNRFKENERKRVDERQREIAKEMEMEKLRAKERESIRLREADRQQERQLEKQRQQERELERQNIQWELQQMETEREERSKERLALTTKVKKLEEERETFRDRERAWRVEMHKLLTESMICKFCSNRHELERQLEELRKEVNSLKSERSTLLDELLEVRTAFEERMKSELNVTLPMKEVDYVLESAIPLFPFRDAKMHCNGRIENGYMTVSLSDKCDGDVLSFQSLDHGVGMKYFTNAEGYPKHVLDDYINPLTTVSDHPTNISAVLSLPNRQFVATILSESSTALKFEIPPDTFPQANDIAALLGSICFSNPKGDLRMFKPRTVTLTLVFWLKTENLCRETRHVCQVKILPESTIFDTATLPRMVAYELPPAAKGATGTQLYNSASRFVENLSCEFGTNRQFHPSKVSIFLRKEHHSSESSDQRKKAVVKTEILGDIGELFLSGSDIVVKETGVVEIRGESICIITDGLVNGTSFGHPTPHAPVTPSKNIMPQFLTVTLKFFQMDEEEEQYCRIPSSKDLLGILKALGVICRHGSAGPRVFTIAIDGREELFSEAEELGATVRVTQKQRRYSLGFTMNVLQPGINLSFQPGERSIELRVGDRCPADYEVKLNVNYAPLIPHCCVKSPHPNFTNASVFFRLKGNSGDSIELMPSLLPGSLLDIQGNDILYDGEVVAHITLSRAGPSQEASLSIVFENTGIATIQAAEVMCRCVVFVLGKSLSLDSTNRTVEVSFMHRDRLIYVESHHVVSAPPLLNCAPSWNAPMDYRESSGSKRILTHLDVAAGVEPVLERGVTVLFGVPATSHWNMGKYFHFNCVRNMDGLSVLHCPMDLAVMYRANAVGPAPKFQLELNSPVAAYQILHNEETFACIVFYDSAVEIIVPPRGSQFGLDMTHLVAEPRSPSSKRHSFRASSPNSKPPLAQVPRSIVGDLRELLHAVTLELLNTPPEYTVVPFTLHMIEHPTRHLHEFVYPVRLASTHSISQIVSSTPTPRILRCPEIGVKQLQLLPDASLQDVPLSFGRFPVHIIVEAEGKSSTLPGSEEVVLSTTLQQLARNQGQKTGLPSLNSKGELDLVMDRAKGARAEQTYLFVVDESGSISCNGKAVGDIHYEKRHAATTSRGSVLFQATLNHVDALTVAQFIRCIEFGATAASVQKDGKGSNNYRFLNLKIQSPKMGSGIRVSCDMKLTVEVSLPILQFNSFLQRPALVPLRASGQKQYCFEKVDVRLSEKSEPLLKGTLTFSVFPPDESVEIGIDLSREKNPYVLTSSTPKGLFINKHPLGSVANTKTSLILTLNSNVPLQPKQLSPLFKFLYLKVDASTTQRELTLHVEFKEPKSCHVDHFRLYLSTSIPQQPIQPKLVMSGGTCPSISLVGQSTLVAHRLCLIADSQYLPVSSIIVSLLDAQEGERVQLEPSLKLTPAMLLATDFFAQEAPSRGLLDIQKKSSSQHLLNIIKNEMLVAECDISDPSQLTIQFFVQEEEGSEQSSGVTVPLIQNILRMIKYCANSVDNLEIPERIVKISLCSATNTLVEHAADLRVVSSYCRSSVDIEFGPLQLNPFASFVEAREMLHHGCVVCRIVDTKNVIASLSVSTSSEGTIKVGDGSWTWQPVVVNGQEVGAVALMETSLIIGFRQPVSREVVMKVVRQVEVHVEPSLVGHQVEESNIDELATLSATFAPATQMCCCLQVAVVDDNDSAVEMNVVIR